MINSSQNSKCVVVNMDAQRKTVLVEEASDEVHFDIY